MAGVVLLLAGLAWDAVMHARDADAAHREGGVFTLASISHVLLLLGGGLAVGSLVTASAHTLAGQRRPKAAIILVVASLVMVAATAGALQWASSNSQPDVATGPLAPAPNPDPHAIGVVNSHADGECRPTKAQWAGAKKLLADTQAATAKYSSLPAALADGYTSPANPAVVDHYPNVPHTQDGKVLDPTRPEALMYTLTARGPVLVGVMYMMNVPGEFGPEPGGCLTRWHVHANLCFSVLTFIPAGEMAPDGSCAAGTFRYIPPPLLHVWFVDVPGGRFAHEVETEHLLKAVGP
jgi:hypothetical protein